TGLCGYDQLVAVRAEVFVHDAPEVDLGAAVRRSVVVCQVEMGYALLERSAQGRATGLEREVVAEVVPEAKRDGGKLQAPSAASPIGHRVVTIGVGYVQRRREISLERHSASIPCRYLDIGIKTRERSRSTFAGFRSSL